MFIAVSRAWPLLLGIALLMLGNGLQGTLLGLRASLEGFATEVTGFIMTGYFAGFLVGSLMVPRLVSRVGHIRVFAALASLASGAVLLHTVFVTPWAWAGFRLVTGLSYAGLYIVAESWLNDAATNETRGELLSIYMVVVLLGMAGGQFLLNVADPAGFELFVLISVLVSMSLLPMTLGAGRAPDFSEPEHIGIRSLYLASPLGVFGAFAVGIAHAGVFGMGAVYANESGLDVSRLAYFMAAVMAGGMLLQWPIGRLSDLFDRRWVITGVTFAAGAFAAGAAVVGVTNYGALLVLTALFGGCSLPLYSLCNAHTNDHLGPRQMVAASSTLVLVGGVGAVLGPGLVALMMKLAGPPGLFWAMALVHGGIGVFALYRMLRREPVPLDEQLHNQAMSSRVSPVMAAIAAGEMRDMRDRELARFSHR